MLQTRDKLSAEAIAEYTKVYGYYKSCFDAIRAKNKPKKPIDLYEFTFDKYKDFKETITHKQFLQYDNRKKGKRILIHASEVGIKLPSQSEKWQSDGTFRSAPKPFKQVYLIIAGKTRFYFC